MHRTLAIAGFLCSLALAPSPARAGEFCGDLDGPGVLRALDRYADGKAGPPFDVACIEQSFGDPAGGKERSRVLVSCTKAVLVPASKRRPEVDRYCVNLVARAGAGKVGDRDLVAELIAAPADWNQPPPYEALAATGDARVRPFVLAAFAQHRATWRKKKLRAAWALDEWARHEVAVLRALAQVGTAADVALIDELAAEPHQDRRVTTAARRARDAAAARAAAAPATP
jgi:hypothetical protein